MKKDLVNLWDLKEGVVYQAYKGNRKLDRRYYQKDLTLYNDNGDEVAGTYVGCSFVMHEEDYKFEALKDVTPNAIVEDTVVNGVMSIKYGSIYSWTQGYLSGDNYVTLNKKKVLSFCDPRGNIGGPVNQSKISQSDEFIFIKQMPLSFFEIVVLDPEPTEVEMDFSYGHSPYTLNRINAKEISEFMNSRAVKIVRQTSAPEFSMVWEPVIEPVKKKGKKK